MLYNLIQIEPGSLRHLQIQKYILLLFVTGLIFTTNTAGQNTAFSYQGKLTDGGTAPTAQYDLQFNLYSVQTGGTPLNSLPVVIENIMVTNGIFNVQLDFGNLFDGANRFLEIGVRPGPSTGSFTILTPRQPITSSPYAVRSLIAGIAENAAQLGGVTASQFIQTNDSRLSDARSPLPGSLSYIQNTTTQQASTNFNISGTGTANVFNAAAQYNINGNRILSNSGTNNLFAGVGAGSLNTGGFNSFFGGNAGLNNTTGNANSFFGWSAGGNNTTGGANSFFGADAGLNNTTGNFNSFFGLSAGEQNTTGGLNAIFGYRAGRANTTGNDNSFIGTGAGEFNTTGSNNTFVGRFAGDINTEGNRNTVLGAGANVASNNLSFATAIGANSVAHFNDTIVLGKAAGTYDGVSRPADAVQIPGMLNLDQRGVGNGTLSNGLAFGLNSGEGIASKRTATGNQYGLDFFTNFTPRLSINNAGNVGIGTTAPTEKLHVVGNALITGTLTSSGAELTNINASNITTGTLDNARLGVVPISKGGTGITGVGAAGNFLRSNGSVWTTSALQTSDIPDLSMNYVKNSTSLQNSSNFNISGTGKANILDAGTQYNLNGNRILSVGSGINSLFVGSGAGNGNTGNANTFFGMFAGASASSSGGNSFFGSNAGSDNTSGDNNSFFGSGTGRNNTTGKYNSLFGYSTGFANISGNGNAFFGYLTGDANTTGGSNTFTGYLAGRTNITGSNNTLIGANSEVNSNNLNFASAIGSHARVSSSDTIVLGKAAGTYNSVSRPADTVLIPGNLNLLGNLTGSFTIDASKITSGTVDADRLPDLSASYIRNQSTQQSSSNFNVSGTGTANILNAATQFNLNGSRILTAQNSENLFAGINAGTNTTGCCNSFFGKDAGMTNVTGLGNSFFGARAGRVTTSNLNSFFGSYAGDLNTTGEQNSFFGADSGSNNTEGSSNTFVGRLAGSVNTTGSNNTLIGAGADLGSNNLNFATAIGSGAVVSTSNTMVLGRTSDTVKVPGRLRASGDLTVGGDIYFDTAGNGFVLKTPNGTQCYRITINNSGNLTSTLSSCVIFSPRPQNEGSGTVEDQNIVSHPENKTNSYSSAPDFDSLKIQTDILQRENSQLRTELKKQQNAIEALKKLLCEQNPDAAICRKEEK